MILKYENLIKEMDKYPYLQKAVEHFYEHDGEPEHEFLLPNLIVWIRCQIDKTEMDMTEWFTEMSEETKEDFWSWGHNSRWGNTFYGFLCEHFTYCMGICLTLAEEYGDFDVENYITENQKEQNDGK